MFNGLVPEFVTVWETPPPPALLVALKSSLGGLKNVIKLDVNDPEDTVTSLANSDRPGTPNGPRLTHGPSPGAAQSRSVVHAFFCAQSDPRTT